MKLDKLKMHKNLDMFALFPVEEYVAFIDESYRAKITDLQKEYDDYVERSFKDDPLLKFELGWVEDRSAMTEEVFVLAGQLAMVALYRVVELRTRRIIESICEEKGGANLYEITRLKEFYERITGRSLEAVSSQVEIDELRLINNSIKHKAGDASSNLAKKFPRWKEGDRLEGLLDIFPKKKDAVKKYLADLAENLKSAC